MRDLRIVATLVAWMVCIAVVWPTTAQGPGEQSPHQLQPDFNWSRGLTGQRITSLSDAELVAQMRRLLEHDIQYLESIQEEIVSETSPFERARLAFEKIDTRFQELVAEREIAEGVQPRVVDLPEQDEEGPAMSETPGHHAAEVEALTQRIAEIEPIRDLAQQRFDLAIERRRMIQQMAPLLESRIAETEMLIRRATGELPEPPVEAEAPDEANAGANNADNGNANGEGATTTLPTLPGYPEIEVPTLPERARQAAEARREELARSAEFIAASGEVDHWREGVELFERQVEALEARLENHNQSIALERELASNARASVDNAEELRSRLNQRYRRLSQEGAPPERVEVNREASAEAAQEARAARERSRLATDRVAMLTDSRGHILEALATRRQDVEIAKTELARAEALVAQIQNPFHPRNLYFWFLDHAPNIIFILVAMIVLYMLVQLMGGRLTKLIADRGVRGSPEERHGRARTLVTAFQQAGSVLILVGGSLMVLDEVGIPIAPLLGGAAVLGLAVAFGAQNLIKDFFQGFMILLENQYKLNDVIQIGDHSGVVERITLRTTILRGLDGTLHFIPNGQIEAVSNMTHGWSRALFDLGVGYGEDVDRVIEVIRDECSKLRDDPQFGMVILEDMEMLGVDDFADSAVMIKFFIKTIPLKQWSIRRELMRRLKHRFDKEGIEIPFPHRTLYLRSADGTPFERALAEAGNHR